MISIRDVANLPQLDTSRWPPFCAVTLTLKKGRQSDVGFWVQADEQQAKTAFRVFINRLNKRVFGNAAHRFGKKLGVIPVVEKETYGRWHIHAAIEMPSRFNPVAFRELIVDCWSHVDWSRERVDFKESANQGWIKYMLKGRQKSDLETWSDCIIWESFHPFVDA
jgi:hypothetical protein